MMLISLSYGLGFLVIFFILIRAVKKASSTFDDALYMLSIFALCKGVSVLLGLRFGGPITGFWLMITQSLSDMFSVIANIFLFQSAIDLLLYKLPTKIKFRIVPLFIFSGYLFLYISNIITQDELERIGRLSFGFHSSILNSIAMFNLYYIIGKRFRGILIAGVGFIPYAIVEGLFLEDSFFGIDKGVIRFLCVLFLLAGFLFIRSLVFVEKKPIDKIAYI